MTATTTTRLDLDFVVMTADFVVWSKILVEVTVNRVCTTAAVPHARFPVAAGFRAARETLEAALPARLCI